MPFASKKIPKPLENAIQYGNQKWILHLKNKKELIHETILIWNKDIINGIMLNYCQGDIKAAIIKMHLFFVNSVCNCCWIESTCYNYRYLTHNFIDADGSTKWNGFLWICLLHPEGKTMNPMFVMLADSQSISNFESTASKYKAMFDQNIMERCHVFNESLWK